MENTKVKKFDIQKFRNDNSKMTDSELISPLFGLSVGNIKSLLDYGFTYDYVYGHFITKIEINNNIHSIYLKQDILEDSKVRRYRLSYQKNKIELKGAENFYLYCELHKTYVCIDIQAIFNHIYVFYIMNHVEKDIVEKETFKQFVENEKKA